MTTNKSEIDRYADAIMTMIDDDIAGGAVPADTRSFTELHDAVDANEYTIQAEIPYDLTDDDHGMDLVHAVENEVTLRLEARMERPAYVSDDLTAYVIPLTTGFGLAWNDGMVSAWSEYFETASAAYARLAVLIECGARNWEYGFAADAKTFEKAFRDDFIERQISA